MGISRRAPTKKPPVRNGRILGAQQRVELIWSVFIKLFDGGSLSFGKMLFDETVDGGVQLFDGGSVVRLDCVHDTIGNVIRQDYLAGAVEGCYDGG